MVRLLLFCLFDSHDRISLYVLEEQEGKILFFNSHDEDLVPSLRLLYQLQTLFPDLTAMKTIKVDTGAIKPLLGGSNIMRPGVVSLGEEAFEAGEYLSVKVEGKEGILAIAKSLKSKQELEVEREGLSFELVHVVGDGLWKFNSEGKSQVKAE